MLRLADADLLVEAIGITDGSRSRNKQGTTANQQRQQGANDAQSSNSVTQSTRRTTGEWVKPHNPTLQLIRPTTVRHNQHTGRRRYFGQQKTIEQMLGVRSPAISITGKHQSFKTVGVEVKIGHCEVSLQPHPGDVLKSTPNDRKSPRSG